ncbi:iron-containing alcohol dehydrogenase [Adhaeretor mobilis]|uniref:1,3-propanediol dehydrogenase n=1 Tax=Adhaeretor mobilis TaxID=1930276 RepID=A0A517N025_9BACT|nr:iron-containing alcohol dehydrogenase [Adhaeretor mobilis]QDT00481.1 1,3-propanediol dehydrogenase [Adhaeretor mobilis]
MSGFDYNCPTKIVFGPGCLDDLGELAAGLGVTRVMVVSDPGIEEVGHTQRGVASLKEAGLEPHIFDGLAENPTTKHVDAGVLVAKEFEPQAIIAIGGGSSMDCAKGVNFLYSCGGSMQDYWGVGKATGDLLPMIAVPTTAGTGSEAQSFALISDAETHVKMACGDKRAAFRIAILDPELTVTQPDRVTALTGIDAISHAVETFVTKKQNERSLRYSLQAWRLLTSGFQQVLYDADDLTARTAMQHGACSAGMAIENSMLGAAHALANPVTAKYDVTHGEAIGIVLPWVVRHNSSDERVAIAYNKLLSETGDTSDESTDQLADYLSQLVEYANLATTLSSCGVERESLPQLAVEAAKQWTGTFNPVEMSTNDYLNLYEQAF